MCAMPAFPSSLYRIPCGPDDVGGSAGIDPSSPRWCHRRVAFLRRIDGHTVQPRRIRHHSQDDSARGTTSPYQFRLGTVLSCLMCAYGED